MAKATITAPIVRHGTGRRLPLTGPIRAGHWSRFTEPIQRLSGPNVPKGPDGSGRMAGRWAARIPYNSFDRDTSNRGPKPLSSVQADEHTRHITLTDVDLPMTPDTPERISRRRLLALGAITGGGLRRDCGGRLLARSVDDRLELRSGPECRAICARRGRPERRNAERIRRAGGLHEPSHAPAPSSAPTVDHDAHAKAVVDRFLGGEGATCRARATSRLSRRWTATRRSSS